MRIRVPPASPGTPIGVREAAKKYGIPSQSVSNWVKAEDVQVLQRADSKGGQTLLDEASLQKKIGSYRPHRDSSKRRIRLAPTAPPLPTAHSPAPWIGGAPSRAGSNGSGGTARIAVRTLVSRYDTAELVAIYLEECREAGLSKKTTDDYWGVLRPFIAAFPDLPYETGDPGLTARDRVLGYIKGLGLAPGSLRNHHKCLRTFYYWLKREKRFASPDLSLPRLKKKEGTPRKYSQEEIHRILHACRTSVERAIVIILAQTAARRGGICTLRRSNMEDGIALVQEKMGPRILYMPDEAWKAAIHGMGGKDFLSPSNVPMGPKTEERIMRALLKRAGVYTKWNGNHAFRHGFADQFEKNGGRQADRTIIMGHSPSDMSGHYYHLANREALAAARQFAPIQFLHCSLACRPVQEVTS